MNAAIINQFWSSFNALSVEISQIHTQIATKQNYGQLNELKQKISELQSLTNVSAGSLPMYDVKRCQQVKDYVQIWIMLFYTEIIRILKPWMLSVKSWN